MQMRRVFRDLIPKCSTIRCGLKTSTSQKDTPVSIAVDDNDETNTEYASARPFHSIPGPKPWLIPYIGNIWRLMPFGTYGKMQMIDVWEKLHQQYGPIVRFYGLADFSHVLLFEPDLTEKMFRNESMLPARKPLQSLTHYREVLRKDFYEDQIGLLISNGPKWREFRTITSQVLLKPQSVNSYLKSALEVSNDFIERIRFIRKTNQEMPDDFYNEINKLSLENFTLMTLDKRLGCFDNNLPPDSEAQKMIHSIRDCFRLMYELDVRPSIWKIYPTKDWKKFVQAMDYVVDFSEKHITEKWEKIKNQKENDVDHGDDVTGNRSILENLLLQSKNPKVAIVMVADTLFAAVDTTSSTIASSLYYLALNPEKQEKLYGELKRLLPRKDSEITHEILNELKYTRAVIKESMRLQPAVPLNHRKTVKDLVLLNYQIPKGTVLLTANYLMTRKHENFKNAEEFIPERWLKSETSSELSYKHAHQFAHLPFGFGQRTCIGKRFAYLEMDVVISKIVRNFKISYHYEPMTWITTIQTMPNRPLKFKVEDRAE